MHNFGSEAKKTVKKKKILNLNNICICDIYDVYVQVGCIEAEIIFLTASPFSSVLQKTYHVYAFIFAGRVTITLQILLEVIPAEEDQKS